MQTEEPSTIIIQSIINLLVQNSILIISTKEEISDMEYYVFHDKLENSLVGTYNSGVNGADNIYFDVDSTDFYKYCSKYTTPTSNLQINTLPYSQLLEFLYCNSKDIPNLNSVDCFACIQLHNASSCNFIIECYRKIYNLDGYSYTRKINFTKFYSRSSLFDHTESLLHIPFTLIEGSYI